MTAHIGSRVQRSQINAIVASVTWFAMTLAFAAEKPRPVQTKIYGVITLRGKPVANKKISSCEVGWDSMPERGARPTCASPIHIATDEAGQFSFQQTGGVLPPTQPSPVADPGYMYWFEIQDGKKRIWFRRTGMGWARSEMQLNCEMRPPRSPGESEQDYRRRDLLECRTEEMTYPVNR